MRRIIPLIALALAAFTAFALPASAQQSSFGYTSGNTEKSLSTFPFPTVEGVAVDHCVRSGRDCGQGGADFLCRMKGFDAASTWKTYKPGQTYILGSKRYCNDANCTGFSTISCVAEKKAPKQAPKKVADQKQAFQFPTFRGVIVDHCERSGRNCGRGGADALCKMKGFDKALDWKVYKPGQTYILGSERLCTDPNCTGFSAVTCTSQHAAKQPAPYTPEPYKAPVAKETFKFPKVQGVVVDHCARFGRNCGKGGADLLCNLRGYDRATDWKTYTVGKTYVIGSQAVCDAPNCTGLSSVSCAGLHHAKKTGADTKKKSTSVGGGLGAILPFLLNPNSQPNSPFFNDGRGRDDRRGFGNDGRGFDNDRRGFGNNQRGFGNNRGFARTGAIRRFAFPQFNGISIDTCTGRGRNCKRGGANLFCRSKGFAEAVRWNTYRAGSTWYTGTNRQCRGGRCVGVTDLICGN